MRKMPGTNYRVRHFISKINSNLAVSFHISHESIGRQQKHRSEAGIERCCKSGRNAGNIPECDSKAYHENVQYPSTSRECLPYLHLGRQRGNPATVSVYDTAEHHEECGRTEAVISKIVKINSELKDANQIKDNYVHSK